MAISQTLRKVSLALFVVISLLVTTPEVKAYAAIKPPSTAVALDTPDQVIFNVVEKGAEFPGGEAALSAFFFDRLDSNDLKLMKYNATTHLYLQMTIRNDGKAIDPIVVRGIRGLYNRKIIDIAKQLPNFKPASQNGRLVWQKLIIVLRVPEPKLTRAQRKAIDKDIRRRQKELIRQNR